MNCVRWSMGDASLHGMGTSSVPGQCFGCYPCPWTKLLPMSPDRTVSRTNLPISTYLILVMQRLRLRMRGVRENAGCQVRARRASFEAVDENCRNYSDARGAMNSARTSGLAAE